MMSITAGNSTLTRLCHALAVALVLLLCACHTDNMSDDVITANDHYTVFPDSVAQDTVRAVAVSLAHITSNYRVADCDSVPNVIRVRLAVNCRDIELLPSQYHYLDLESDSLTVTAMRPDTVKLAATHRIARPRQLTVQVDLRPVEEALKRDGFCVTPTRDTVYASDYKGVWLTADIAPLNVDASLCRNHPELKVEQTATAPGIYEVKIPLGLPRITLPGEWQMKGAISDMPGYESDQLIVNAVYNMSLERLNAAPESVAQQLVGQQCYAIALSLAYLRPAESMKTLRAMVNEQGVITSPGEGYRQAANNLIWTEAAWSVYCATGDRLWLREAYKVAAASVTAVVPMLHNSETGLLHAVLPYASRGISDFYPEWMNTVDVMDTYPLAANAITMRTYRLLELMTDEFELSDTEHGLDAERLKDAINHKLWNENKEAYVQYLYGGAGLNAMSPCVDNFAQALAVLWDIADDDRAEALMEATPVTHYGVPLVYPSPQGNNSPVRTAVSPMSQALWNLAAAKTGNINMLRRGLGALIRMQALAASCDYDFDAITGEVSGAGYGVGNAAGTVAMALRVIAGLNFLPNGIEFSPRVPVCFDGTKKLLGLKYRNATLDIVVKGTGVEIKKITLDGRELADNFIAGDIAGHHKVVITMNNDNTHTGRVTLVQPLRHLPATPQWLWQGFYGTNYNYSPSLGYKILINGVSTYSMRDSVLGTRDTVTFRNYSLVAINKYGPGYIARPHYIMTQARAWPTAPQNVHTADSAVTRQPRMELGRKNRSINVTVNVPEAGDYYVDVLYANGNDPTLSGCAFLEVLANGHSQGALPVPTLGSGVWLQMQYTAKLGVKLLKGENRITLRLATLQPGNRPPGILAGHLRLVKR